jgi:hypothetical protein
MRTSLVPLLNNMIKFCILYLSIVTLIGAQTNQWLESNKPIKSLTRQQQLKIFKDLRLSTQKIRQKPYIILVDLSQKNSVFRALVYNTQTQSIEDSALVAHGKGSAPNHTWAERFSNTNASEASSLGLYLLKGLYTGKHGESIQLKGLDTGFNHLALERAIVMHAAEYMDSTWIQKHGHIGRSFGCPAFSHDFAKKWFSKLKGGSVLLVYGDVDEWKNEQKWFKNK